MSNESQAGGMKTAAKINELLSRPLFRFLVAGLIATVVTIIILLFMRFLMMGYDKSATDAITRYFTLRTVVLSEGEGEGRARVERPTDRPDVPAIDDNDSQQESAASLDETSFDIPAMPTPERNIEREILMPELEPAPLSTQEKLRQIKQGILAEDE